MTDQFKMEREQLFLLRYLYFLDQARAGEYHFANDLLNEFEKEFGSHSIQSQRITDWLSHLEKRELILVQIGDLQLPTHYARISQEGRIYYQENIDQFKEFDRFFEGKNINSLFEFPEEQSRSGSPQYWLVGSYWYHANPRERLGIFVENNEWINGYEGEKFAEDVNDVREGDILICKSSYFSVKYKSSTLRLKGYGIVINNPKDETRLEVAWKASGWKHDLPEYGYYRETITKVYANDTEYIKSKLQEAIDGIFEEPIISKLPRRKHALSKSESDEELIERGYKNQGIIGYSKDTYIYGYKELFQRYLHHTEDFIYFFESTFGNENEGSAYDTTTIGFTDVVNNSENIRFHRFYSKENSDHIYCTSPDLELLEQEGYVEEANQGFEASFLFTKKQEGHSPLFVYSTDEEVRLFTPLDEVTQQSYDTTSPLHSDSATGADLDAFGRSKLTEIVVNQVDDLFKSGEYNDSYTILLDGEWGTGKSSMLNFFKKHLSNKGWKLIEYNAWENQSFNDPWWILINKISKEAKSADFKGDFHSHRYWKFKLQYRNQFWALMLLAVFITSTAVFGSLDSFDGSSIPFIGSVLGIIGSVISVITGLSNNFFYKNISSEGLKEKFSDHPYKEIRQRFEEIAKENDMVILIDDLDRCSVNATVTLLESIQTLFKGQKVLYIIAADGKWVSQCFSKKYEDFEKVAEPGVMIGDKFLQKSFQLRVPVPKINKELLRAYYHKLIEHIEEVSENVSNQQKDENKQERFPEVLESKQEVEQLIERKSEEIKEDIKKNEPKYLSRFANDFEGSKMASNPRQIKRFINQYSVERQLRNIETGQDSFEDEDVKLLMLSMSYPSLGHKLEEGLIGKEDFLETDPKKQKEIIKELTHKQLEDIRKILK